MVLLIAVCHPSFGQAGSDKPEELDAAKVTASMLIRRSGGRIIYDVSGDPDASRISMAEMLRRIPGLKHSAVNGKLEFENVQISKILIDDTESGVVNERRQYPMQFIKADYMSSFELILPGSPEYSNNEAVLVIRLARELPFGVASQLSAVADTKGKMEPSVDAMINTPIGGFGLGYGFDRESSPAVNSSFERITDAYSTVDKERSERKGSSHVLSFNYSLPVKKDKGRLSASLNSTRSDEDAFTYSESDVINKLTGSQSHRTSNGRIHSASPFLLSGAVKYQQSFGPALGKRKVGRNRWELSYSFNQNKSLLTSDNDSVSRFSATSNIEHRLVFDSRFRDVLSGPFRMSMMMKAGVYDRRNSESTDNVQGSDSWFYHQNVCFTDASAVGSFSNNRFGYVANVTLEGINNSGDMAYREVNIVPKLQLTRYYKLWNISLIYNQNVNRPTFRQLNPYRDESNPGYVRTGNPGLRGSRTHYLSLNAAFQPRPKWFTSFYPSFYYSFADGQIGPVTMLNEDGTAVLTYANIKSSRTVGIELKTGFRLDRKTSLNLYLSSASLKSVLPSGKSNSIFTPRGMVSVSRSGKWFDINADIGVRPTSVSAQVSELNFDADASMSISKYFEKEHLGLSLSLCDLLHSNGTKTIRISDGDFSQISRIGRVGRYASLRIYWQFGHFRHSESVFVQAHDM